MARRKYGNQPTLILGIKFHSKAEAHRYLQLRDLEARGEIEGLELQPRYRLEVNGQLICHFVGDFRYTVSGLIEVEDIKGGPTTPAFKLKKKLMWAIHGIEVKEVRL